MLTDVVGIINKRFIVDNPLDYDNFTKNTGALRENGQKVSREATMKFESIIKNRRLAIVFLLNKCYRKKKLINFDDLVSFLLMDKEYFIINKNEFSDVMSKELFFAYMCGIPFTINSNKNLMPMVGINEKIICKNAPQPALNFLDKFKQFI